MKNQISFYTALFVLLFSFSIKAQTRYDVGLEFLPSLSKIYTKSNSDYQFLYPVNYGVRFAVRHNKFIYSTGVLHFTQGSKLIIDIVDEGNPEGGTGNATFYIGPNQSWFH